MRKSQFTEAQIAFVLKQAEAATPVAEECRKASVPEASFDNWRKRYAGLVPSEVKRLRQLEEENSKLKRIVADLSLDQADLKLRIKQICETRVRCGYRRIHVLLKRGAGM